VSLLKEKIDTHCEKVPEHVQLSNNQKLSALQAEMGTIETAISNFKKLAL
jgi:hypothetical protein